MAVEQEEAEAGATFEKNQKLAIVRSEEEAKEAELEVIRSESKASVPEVCRWSKYCCHGLADWSCYCKGFVATSVLLMLYL